MAAPASPESKGGPPRPSDQHSPARSTRDSRISAESRRQARRDFPRGPKRRRRLPSAARAMALDRRTTRRLVRPPSLVALPDRLPLLTEGARPFRSVFAFGGFLIEVTRIG